jgi:hypothetical protein
VAVWENREKSPGLVLSYKGKSKKYLFRIMNSGGPGKC